METIFKDAEEHTLKRFKSYYVVWKPRIHDEK